MTLWGLLVPGVLLVITAFATHIRHTYWLAVRLAFTRSVILLIVYWVLLRLVLAGGAPFEWTELLALMVFAVAGGIMGIVLSMLVGLPIAADRRLAARQQDSGDDVT